MNKIIISSVIFTVIDLLWLKFYMTDKYNIMINIIQNSSLKLDTICAFFAYLTLCFSLNYFVLPYVTENDCRLITHSFMFGLVMYAVYDFTCGAIFKDWDKKLMIIDIIWGGVVFCLSNYLTNLIINKKILKF